MKITNKPPAKADKNEVSRENLDKWQREDAARTARNNSVHTGQERTKMGTKRVGPKGES